MNITIPELENTELTSEVCREIGKLYFFHNDGDNKKRSTGLQLLLKAYLEGDPEAIFIIGDLMLKQVLKPTNGDDPVAFAMKLFQRAANSGCIQARAQLNSYCEERYTREFDYASQSDKNACGLVDFDGCPIQIDRKGIFTPIDATLECRNGVNVLTLRANIMFLYEKSFPNRAAFEEAVLSGIQEWQGEYEVFGGQKLVVEVHLTTEPRLLDNVIVMPLTEDLRDTVRKVNDTILRWSVNSRKIIYLQSRNGLFDAYEEIKHVAKHKFGHALGLGDLYESPMNQLQGVESGTYRELDSYYISDRIYNLVMCDYHGPVSNNDIEMIVLAFRENEVQLYQKRNTKGKVSTALGKGN